MMTNKNQLILKYSTPVWIRLLFLNILFMIIRIIKGILFIKKRYLMNFLEKKLGDYKINLILYYIK